MTNADYYRVSFEKRCSLRRINNLLEEESIEDKIDIYLILYLYLIYVKTFPHNYNT